MGFMDLFKKNKVTVNTSDFSLRQELMDKIEMEWQKVFEWRLGQVLNDALNIKGQGAQMEVRLKSISDEEWMSIFYRIKHEKREYDLTVLADKHSPTRIPIIMKVIREYWKAHPELRFSQIIADTLEKQQPGGNLYGARDSIWQTLVLSETPASP